VHEIRPEPEQPPTVVMFGVGDEADFVIYGPTYYAAFAFDPDGFNIEAVCHAEQVDL